MASAQFRVAIVNDKTEWSIEQKLCETYEEAMDEVLRELEKLQDKPDGEPWHVELTIYKYRWRDTSKFGKGHWNETLEPVKYYPKDYDRRG